MGVCVDVCVHLYVRASPVNWVGSLIAKVILLVAQSVFLGYISEYFFIDSPTPDQTRDAYLFSLGVALASVAVAFVHAHGFQMGFRSSMDVRIVATSAIYQKVTTENTIIESIITIMIMG